MEPFETYSVDDLADFLLEKNIPTSIVSIFSGKSTRSLCSFASQTLYLTARRSS